MKVGRGLRGVKLGEKECIYRFGPLDTERLDVTSIERGRLKIGRNFEGM